MAKNNQKTKILDILLGAKKKINPLTYYSMLGGPFFKSHPVEYWKFLSSMIITFLVDEGL